MKNLVETPSEEASTERGWFDRFATAVDHSVSQPAFFALSVLAVLLWAIWGPFAHFSSVWQLVINTATTILTFLMVGLAANAGARSDKALQLKLNAIAQALAAHMSEDRSADERDADVEELRQAVGLEHQTSS